jgi:hypothetical protein
MASWPTPTLHDAERGGQEKRAMGETRHGSNLQDFALTAPWPTPMAGTPAQKGYNEAGNTDASRKTVALSPWPTPAATDDKTPGGTDRWKEDRGKKGMRLNDHMLHRGPTSSGSPAQTESKGQLSPAFSLWLMGYPFDWVLAAPSRASRGSRCSGEPATRLSRKSQPSS